MFDPSWKKHEKDIGNDNAKKSIEATEKFIAEREHEIEIDTTARKWEADRKADIAKQKPSWKKSQLKKEKEEQEKSVKDLLDAGVIDTYIKPTPGHIVINLDKKEVKTNSGIYLPSEESTNTGIVFACGKALVCKHCFAEARHQDSSGIEPTPPPVNIGDRVLFKKGAGIEITIQGEKCKLMAFSDILAKIYESEDDKYD